MYDKLWKTMPKRGIFTYALREWYNIESRTIRRLRANQNVATGTLDKLCRILDCPLDAIATYRPEQKGPLEGGK